MFDRIRMYFLAQSWRKEFFFNRGKHVTASGWWAEFEFAAKRSLLFWVKSDCASASTDPLLHANAIYAILSKTKKALGYRGYCVRLSARQLPWNHPVRDSEQIPKSINALRTKIRSCRIKTVTRRRWKLPQWAVTLPVFKGKCNFPSPSYSDESLVK